MIRLKGIISGALIAMLAACTSPHTIPPQPSFYHDLTKPGSQLDVQAAISMISDYRKNNGLAGVSLDPKLTLMAQEQAASMARIDKLSHDAGGSFQQRLKNSTYNAATAVENISAGYLTLAEAFSGWRDSPQHNRNMLHKSAAHMGIAAVHVPGTKYRVFWALVLASPDK